MATQAEPTDSGPAAVVRRVRLGDAEALGELYDAFGASLFRLAYRLTGTRDDAEDVVHDVFVGLPEALGRYEERGSFGGWLKRVTARVALMRLRSGKRRREVALEATLPAADPPPDPAGPALPVAVDALPEPLRSVL